MFNNNAHSGRIKTEIINDVGIYECKDWNVAGTCKYTKCLKSFEKNDKQTNIQIYTKINQSLMRSN